jgi:cytochrome c oxidase subunit 3/cytochrome c oxidase subunit I+III
MAIGAAPPEATDPPRLDALPPDTHRGTAGMALAIVTEALLFVSLFFAYFYVGHQHRRWPVHPPKLELALLLLAVLLASSLTLELAVRRLAAGGLGGARALLAATIGLGALFLVLQSFEYRDRLREVQPTSNAYGSLFYAITGFHALHVVAGLAMLVFVSCLPTLEPERSPHRPLNNAALYWHFVDAVWIVVVGLLYLLPRWSA